MCQISTCISSPVWNPSNHDLVKQAIQDYAPTDVAIFQDENNGLELLYYFAASLWTVLLLYLRLQQDFIQFKKLSNRCVKCWNVRFIVHIATRWYFAVRMIDVSLLIFTKCGIKIIVQNWQLSLFFNKTFSIWNMFV